MISKHCGVRLVRLSTDIDGDTTKKHRWQCLVCKKLFAQKLRKAKK